MSMDDKKVWRSRSGPPKPPSFFGVRNMRCWFRRQAAMVRCFRLFVVASAVLALPDGAGALGNPAPNSATQFEPAAFKPLGNQAAPKTRLDLGFDHGTVEELVVYGRRRQRSDDLEKPMAPLTLGPVTVTGSTATRLPGFRGMQVTGSVPIPGAAGLRAEANLSAGHDQVNTSATAASAAATIGLKLDF